MTTQQMQREKWEALAEEFTAQCDLIDADTPPDPPEPHWWVKMVTARRAVRRALVATRKAYEHLPIPTTPPADAASPQDGGETEEE